MKLSFSTLGCPDWDINRVVTQAKELGFSGVEVRGIAGKMGINEIECFKPENREATLKLFADNHVSLCGIGTSSMFHSADNYDKALEEAKATIDLCRAMDIPFIRVFGDAIGENECEETVVNRVINGIREAADYAKDGKHVKVLLEIHGNFNTVDRLTKICEALKDNECFGIIWDIEHSYREYGDDFVAFYNVIKPYIYHTHIKDCTIVDGKIICELMGEGTVNAKPIIKKLLEDGYDGYFSFEWEKKWYPSLPEPEIAFPHYINYMIS